jgi:hypothetical protein
MKMISPALASVLRSGRAEFNARFAAARHLYPQLNGEAFTQFLQTAVDELAQATERVRADRLGDVVMAAYDAALELTGQNLAGSGSRQPVIEDAWRRVLPKATPLVANAPTAVIAAVCNAVHQLASTPGARPEQWIDMMETLAPECADVEVFLKLGQVAGWRAGLAHFRKNALVIADALPESLALAAVGAKSKAGWPIEREKLLSNPWHDPSEGQNSTGLRAVAQVGAFRGFGGLFVEPPEVAASGQQFMVRSGGDCWLLAADLFGATFHRAAPGEFDVAKHEHRLPLALKVSGTRVMLNEQPFEFPALGEFTSVAANVTTLALTGRFTHSVVLAALQ